MNHYYFCIAIGHNCNVGRFLLDDFVELQPSINCLHLITRDLNHHTVQHMMTFLQFMVWLSIQRFQRISSVGMLNLSSGRQLEQHRNTCLISVISHLSLICAASGNRQRINWLWDYTNWSDVKIELHSLKPPLHHLPLIIILDMPHHGNTWKQKETVPSLVPDAI